MKKFRIVSWHEIFIDDYEQGEKDYINSFDLSGIYEADNCKDAVNMHLSEHGYNLGLENCEVNEESNELQTSCLVDEDNMQPSTHDLELWKQGKKVLFVDYINIQVEELIRVTF